MCSVNKRPRVNLYSREDMDFKIDVRDRRDVLVLVAQTPDKVMSVDVH